MYHCKPPAGEFGWSGKGQDKKNYIKSLAFGDIEGRNWNGALSSRLYIR